MNSTTMGGIVCLIIGIVFLGGALFEYSIAAENQDTQNENINNPLYTDDTEKEDDETIEQQLMFATCCGGIFFIFLIVGCILMVVGAGKKEQVQPMMMPQPMFPQQYPQPMQPVYQQPPPVQYQQPPQQQPQPPYQQPQYQPPPQASGTLTCPTCGSEVQEGWQVCPNCSTLLY